MRGVTLITMATLAIFAMDNIIISADPVVGKFSREKEEEKTMGQVGDGDVRQEDRLDFLADNDDDEEDSNFVAIIEEMVS